MRIFWRFWWRLRWLLKGRRTKLPLSPIAQAVRNDRLTYLSPLKLYRLERSLEDIIHADVSGDIVEFGVALGGSGIILAKHAKDGRHFIGFDLFAMIPAPCSDNDNVISKLRYRVIASGRSKGIRGDLYYGYRENLLTDVKSHFQRYDLPVDGHCIQLHKGLFQDTWPKAVVEHIAFAHIDCDWYEPVKYCLEAVAPVLAEKGAIVIDDYYSYSGCRVAVEEFLSANPDFQFEDGPNPILRRAQ